MAQPFLEFLTGRARIALPYLRGASARGLTTSAALALLKELGIAIRTQTATDIYAALRGRANPEQYSRLIPSTEPLPYEAHGRNIQPQEENYQYVVEVFHPQTGNQQYIQFASAIPLSRNLIDARVEMIFAAGEKYAVTFEQLPDSSITIVEASTSLSAP
jgi:hypothetical protein